MRVSGARFGHWRLFLSTDQWREKIHSSSEPQKPQESKDPPSEHAGEQVRLCVRVCVCVISECGGVK